MASAKQVAKDVDEYIANASDETRPILIKLRRMVRQASPKLQETIKWSVPCYVHKGPVAGFAAYKKHVSWGLWKSRLVRDPDGLLDSRGIVMGGKISSMSEMPPASKLIALIQQVIALNEAGVKNPKPPDPKLPSEFDAALKKNRAARMHYVAFTSARKWQYVNWINQAKRSETRAKRIAASIERISQGKTLK